MSIHLDKRGVERQDHYGAGRQPWDMILSQGWAPEFAAGNVLKYLRRSKEDQAVDLKKARWYWDRLYELKNGEIAPEEKEYPITKRYSMARSNLVLSTLTEMLTKGELHLLTKRGKTG